MMRRARFRQASGHAREPCGAARLWGAGGVHVVLYGLGLATLYGTTVLALTALAGSFTPMSGAGIWPMPAGLLCGALLLAGPRLAPVLIAAHALTVLALTGATGTLGAPGTLEALGTFGPAAGMPIAAIAAPLASGAVALLLRRLKLDPRLATARDAGLLVGGMLAAATLSSALAALLLMVHGDPLPAVRLDARLAAHGLGTLAGLIVVTPFVLAVADLTARGRRLVMDEARLAARLWRSAPIALELAAALLLTAALAAMVAPDDPQHLAATAGHLLFIPLTWMALRHGWQAVAVTVMLAGSAIIRLLPDAVIGGRPDTLALTILVQSVVALVIGIVVNDRRRARAMLEHEVAGRSRDLCREIAERKQAAQALEGAVARLNHAEQVARLGHWQRDIGSNRSDWSPGMFALLGLPPQAVTPGPAAFLERVHPEDRQRVEAACVAAHAHGTPCRTQVRIVRPDGSVGHIECQVEIRAGSDGTPATMFGVALDLTDKMAAEQALRDSEQRYRSLVETTQFGIVEIDRDGYIVYASPAMYRLAGRSGGSLRGTHVLDLVGEPERPGLTTAIDRMLGDAAAVRPYLSRLAAGRDDDGTAVEIDWAPKRDKAGTVTGFVGLITDITARKRAETDLHRFRAIVEASHEAIAVTDVHGRIVYANPAHERLFGRSLGSSLGHGVPMENGDLYTPESLGTLEAEVYPRCRRGESWEGVLHGRDAAGRTFPVWERRDALRGPDGVPILIIAMLHDHSGEERRQSEIREARDRAEQANVAKSRFLAAASHDLRQPLQALVIFFDLLSRRNRAPELDELIGKIGQSLNVFQDMLNALLDISKLDAGIVAPDVRDIALGPLLDRLHDEFTPVADANGLAIRVVPTSLVVRSDPHLLERMLRNLLANAIRYTPCGRVLLGCRRAGGTVRLQVCDTGVGIPEDQLRAIFGEYYQIDNQARDRRQGLGLGLAIVDRLAGLLGHPVRVRSAVGRGTLFEIEVPATPAASAPASAMALPEILEPWESAAGLIAVLDDDPDVLRALQMSLEGFGHEVIAAPDTDQLVDTLREAGRSPDIIMADFSLGAGGTGSRAIHDLRRVFGLHIPGILLTGDTSPDRLKEASASGFHLLHKPIRPAELSRLVDDYLLLASAED